MFGSGFPPGRSLETTSPDQILLQEVERAGHDLVIRSQEADWVTSPEGPRAAVNERLFRSCSCPVWAVGVRPKLKRPAIVAAVNVLSPDRLTQALNRKVIPFALSAGRLLDGEIVVLHAWRQPAEKRFRGVFTRAHFDALQEASELGAADALHRFVDSFGHLLRGSRVELRHGFAEQAIPRFVVSEGMDIVVAGARGRGFWPLLFGSTAERLLRTTTCSVVAVKAR